ncbi:MAG: ATP-binding cassette domain-containing protein, partial [Microbacterium sp.]
VQGIGDGRPAADVSFSVGRGEIVGITGVLGSGASEVVEMVTGLRAPRRGRITLDGAPYRPATPAAALARGVALIPRDRRHEGLVLDFPVERNLTLNTLGEDVRAGLLDRRRNRDRANGLIGRLDIRPADPAAIAGRLSGGNQQKVVLGRGLAAGATLLVLDEPTVGVDIGAKEEIYRLLAELADGGAGILVASTDPAEIIGLCDRVLVMLRGRVVDDLPTEQLALEDLISRMTGSGAEPKADAA